MNKYQWFLVGFITGSIFTWFVFVIQWLIEVRGGNV